MISGIATAVKGLRPDARVIAIEPERSPALHESLKAREPVTVEQLVVIDLVKLNQARQAWMVRVVFAVVAFQQFRKIMPNDSTASFAITRRKN